MKWRVGGNAALLFCFFLNIIGNCAMLSSLKSSGFLSSDLYALSWNCLWKKTSMPLSSIVTAELP